MPEARYTADNCRVAYQLHWSLTAFTNEAIPAEETWRRQLSQAIEPDDVRLLEVAINDENIQFLLSTKPEISPAAVVRSIKGRLQYLLRNSIPKLWRRHYSIASVGDANNEALQGYVGRQVEHHPMADLRVVDRLSRTQFHDPHVDLNIARASAHGRFVHNLHVVIENTGRLTDVREEWLQTTRQMAIAVCRKKGWLLSRLGIVGNHIHVLLGCGVDENPCGVVLSLMNNLAYAHGMKRVFENSFYVGTFGPYDHQAIRRVVASQKQ